MNRMVLKGTKTRISITFALLAFCWLTTANMMGKDILISEVPKRVMDAALEAVADFEVLEAEKEWEWGRLIFELSGVSGADGVFYEVEVTPKGKVLEIEKGGKIDDDDDDDDD